MAKKVRRVKKRTNSRKSRQSNRSAAAKESASSGRRSRSKETASAPEVVPEEELKEEYAYVTKDLRRVAILAAAMFALLILINLVL